MIVRRPATEGWPLAAAVAAVALLLYAVRYALLPFIVAGIIGFAAEPLLEWGRRCTDGRRWPAAVLLSALLVGSICIGAIRVGTVVVLDAASVLERWPQIAQNLVASVVGSGLDIAGHLYTPDEIAQRLFAGETWSPAVILAGGGIPALYGIFDAVLTLVLIPYFLICGPRIAAGLIWLVPPRRRGVARNMLSKLVPLLQRYLIGLFLVFTYTAVTAWVAFGPLFGLPHAPLLAVTVAVLEIIPFVGPVMAALLVGLMALQRNDIWSGAMLMAFVVALRLSVDNLVGPIVLGRSANIHPVVVIFAFVCGAVLFGVIGLLLAVPVASIVKLGLEHLYAGSDDEPATL